MDSALRTIMVINNTCEIYPGTPFITTRYLTTVASPKCANTPNPSYIIQRPSTKSVKQCIKLVSSGARAIVVPVFPLLPGHSSLPPPLEDLPLLVLQLGVMEAAQPPSQQAHPLLRLHHCWLGECLAVCQFPTTAQVSGSTDRNWNQHKMGNWTF